jgi:hypothetical protein
MTEMPAFSCPHCNTPMEARPVHWFCPACFRAEPMSDADHLRIEQVKRESREAEWAARQRTESGPPLLLGLDLGQVSDPTALAAAEQAKREEDGLRVYSVRHLQRWALGTTYPDIVDDVGELLVKLPGRKVLVVDGTGVGRPVLDMFRKAGLPARIVPCYIHGGGTTGPGAGGGFNVPKKELASAVQSCLQTRRLNIAPALPETKQLVKELQTFTAKINISTGAETLEAWRTRDQDDLVLAVAMLCWYGEHGQRRLSVFC